MGVISCVKIRKRFGGVVALRDATLDLHAGEIHALVGGNGSGKSTLAKILAGCIFPDDGSILVDGEPVHIGSPSDAFHLGIAITYQELSLLSNLRVDYNLFLRALPVKSGFWVNMRELRKRAEDLMGKFGLEEMATKRVGDLDINDQYMLELIKELVRKPKFLIIDELTSTLRREQVRQVSEILQELAYSGTAILFISHRLYEVINLCNIISIMRNGVVVEREKRIDQTSVAEIISQMSAKPKENSKQRSSSFSVKTVPKRTSSLKNFGAPLLSVRGLKLPGRSDKIKFDIHAGEIVGLGGLQGQGQSELLRALFGAIRLDCDSHTVKIAGREVRIVNPSDALREGVVFISGDREVEGVFAIRSILENLQAVPGAFRRNDAMIETPQKVIDRLGIVIFGLAQKMKNLSGGNQQKVVIGRWLGVTPRVLLADDPTKGVDVQSRYEVHRIFRDLTSKGCAIIIASSEDDELVKLTDRIFIMYGGKISCELKGEDVTENRIVEASFPHLSEEIEKDD